MQGTEQDGAPRRSSPRRGIASRRRITFSEPGPQGMALVLGGIVPDGVDGIAVPGPEGLDTVLLATMGADRVICPLFADGFDAMAVAARLAKLGFGGTLYVLAPDLPNPRMVEREIRAQGGGIDVRLIALKPPSP